MKILAHVHTYGKNAESGADKFMQSILEFLAQRGEMVTVAIDNPYPEKVLNLGGVWVVSNKYMIAEQYEESDIIISHLVFNNPSLKIARRFNKPVIQIAHNSENKTNEGYIIYNSESLKNSLNLPLPGIVVNPPTYLKDWQNDIDHFTQPYITLVNCCHNKGGETLKALAQWMPQYKFLGIMGGYGKQMRMPAPNITYRAYSEKMDYSDTKILIVPSKKESWSLAAAEAMASGIPVLCSDLPGLRENCGEAAKYCNSVAEFKNMIELLNDYSLYLAMVFAGQTKVVTRDHATQLNNLYNFIHSIVKYHGGTMKVESWMLKDFSEIEKESLQKEIERLKDKYEPKEKKEMKPTKEKKELHGSPFTK